MQTPDANSLSPKTVRQAVSAEFKAGAHADAGTSGRLLDQVRKTPSLFSRSLSTEWVGGGGGEAVEGIGTLFWPSRSTPRRRPSRWVRIFTWQGGGGCQRQTSRPGAQNALPLLLVSRPLLVTKEYIVILVFEVDSKISTVNMG